MRGGTTTRVLGPRASWSKVPTEGQLSIHEHLYNPLPVEYGLHWACSRWACLFYDVCFLSSLHWVLNTNVVSGGIWAL